MYRSSPPKIDRQQGDHLRRLFLEPLEDRLLMAVIDLATLTSVQGSIFFGSDTKDYSGRSVSGAGDVNGDGFNDLLIGANWADGPNNSRPYAGDSYLIFGNASVPSTLDLSSLGSAGITIFGANRDDGSGVSVSGGGDVNGDGFADLIIGARDANGFGSGKSRAGKSFVVFGSGSLPSTIDLSNLGSSGITIFGVDLDDRSGISVGNAGDVNGDGFDDILIGAIHADALGNMKPNAGECYLIFGGISLPTTIDLTNLGALGTTIYGAETLDECGSSVSSAGDINGDGIDDLLIGARFADGSGNTKSYAGDSYVIFGKTDWSTTPTIDLNLPGLAGVTIFGADIGDKNGVSVASAGDVNGDGFDDVIIGAYAADALGNTKSFAGDSYLVFGGTSLPATLNLASLGTAGITIYGADAGDLSGLSVSGGGDVNGDGYDDLLIGAFSSSGIGNSKLNAGESYVLFGATVLPSSISLLSLGASVGMTIYGSDAGDASGTSVSFAGDVNGDGFDDLIIGAPKASSIGNNKLTAGESYLIYGSDLTSAITHQGSSAGETLTGNATANVMNGGRGDDLLIGNGGADVLTGGQGNDVIAINNFEFKRIVGGTGNDNLRLDGAGLVLDLTALSDSRISGIEIIDISGSGINTLTLNSREVLNLSDSTNTLMVRCDPDDIVNRGNGWTQLTYQTIGNRSFSVFAQGAAKLFVQIPYVAPTIQEAYLYYKNSSFASLGLAAAIDPIDDGAGNPDGKDLLKSGSTSQPTTFSNVSNYSRGINGLVWDINYLVPSLTTSDFVFRSPSTLVSGPINPSVWGNAPTPSAIVVTSGSPSQIRIEWDDNAIQNTWLQVIIKANSNTGLSSPSVFYIGHALGDANGNAPYKVNNSDLAAVQPFISAANVLITNSLDINKDKKVNNQDLNFIQTKISAVTLLNNITIPVAGSANEGSGSGSPLIPSSLATTSVINHATELRVAESTSALTDFMGNSVQSIDYFFAEWGKKKAFQTVRCPPLKQPFASLVVL